MSLHYLVKCHFFGPPCIAHPVTMNLKLTIVYTLAATQLLWAYSLIRAPKMPMNCKKIKQIFKRYKSNTVAYYRLFFSTDTPLQLLTADCTTTHDIGST